MKPGADHSLSHYSNLVRLAVLCSGVTFALAVPDASAGKFGQSQFRQKPDVSVWVGGRGVSARSDVAPLMKALLRTRFGDIWFQSVTPKRRVFLGFWNKLATDRFLAVASSGHGRNVFTVKRVKGPMDRDYYDVTFPIRYLRDITRKLEAAPR